MARWHLLKLEQQGRRDAVRGLGNVADGDVALTGVPCHVTTVCRPPGSSKTTITNVQVVHCSPAGPLCLFGSQYCLQYVMRGISLRSASPFSFC